MLNRTLILTLALVGLTFGGIRQAQAEPLVAYTTSVGFGVDRSNRLITFDSATPGTVINEVGVTGLQQLLFERLVGVDYRPANGLLYGLSNLSRLYVLNPLTGVAVFTSQLSTPLGESLTSYGVDFDPVTDRLRVVGNDDQNLRINVDTGEAIVDTPINPAERGITALAYTNSFAGATETTLYGIDNTRAGNFLVIQNPADSGTVTDVGSLNLTFAVFSDNGFDISGQTGIAYFAGRAAPSRGARSLYTINLVTGQATNIGIIGDGLYGIEGLAVPTGGATAVPEPATMILLGTGLAGVAAKLRRRRKTDA